MHVAERAIAAIAGRQDNVITLEQLRRAGLGRRALDWRVTSGSLQRLHRGVYLVGPAPPSFPARARAAALAVGPRAVVSHEAAAALHGLRPPRAGDIDVTVDGRCPRRRAGIVVHRSSLVRTDVGLVHGIPVTSPARTICDLAAGLAEVELGQLLIDARQARCVTDRELRTAAERTAHRPGAAAMRALLTDEREDGYSRSIAERKLRALICAAGLATPGYNAKVQGFLVDGVWAAQKLILEVDGRTFHGHAAAFEADRRRDQILVAAGFRVIRVTWRQLVHEPIGVAVRIAQALAQPIAA